MNTSEGMNLNKYQGITVTHDLRIWVDASVPYLCLKQKNNKQTKETLL